MTKRLAVLYLLLVSSFVGLLLSLCDLTPEPDPLADEHYPYIELREDAGATVSLAEMNRDFQGWLHIPDTGISYPVVLGEDNSFYLKHSFTGQPNVYGCLFFDTRSFPGAQNRVIHGHNMGAGREEMFSSLVTYQEQGFADAHKALCFTDRSGTVCWYEVFAVVNFDTGRLDQIDYRTPDFSDREDYDAFVSFLREESVYSAVSMPKGEDLLILSTCNTVYGIKNRLLVCAKKIS